MTIQEILTNGADMANQKVSFSALVKSVTNKNTKSGKPFLECTLVDKTGEISFKKWNADNNDVALLKPNEVLEFIDVDVNIFNGMTSVVSNEACYIPLMNYDRNDYVFTILKDPEGAARKISEFVNSIKNERIRNICLDLMERDEFKERFYTYPAGNKMHHAETYGLVCHTERIMEAVDKLCGVYPCNRDIVIAAVLFHDVGKIFELKPNAAGIGEYTKYALLGHIYIGASMIEEYYNIGLITEEEYLLLTHCVLAHHGKKDWGSPVEPMIPEAVLIHAIDSLDAQMNPLENKLAHLGDGEFRDWVYNASSKISQ